MYIKRTFYQEKWIFNFLFIFSLFDTQSEYAYYSLIEEDEPISAEDLTPGILKNVTSQSFPTKTPSQGNSGTSSNNGSSSSSSANTVERQALYKIIQVSQVNISLIFLFCLYTIQKVIYEYKCCSLTETPMFNIFVPFLTKYRQQ